jgi:molybdopterin-guanine dinucleotide biosynthesis protein
MKFRNVIKSVDILKHKAQQPEVIKRRRDFKASVSRARSSNWEVRADERGWSIKDPSTRLRTHTAWTSLEECVLDSCIVEGV